MTDDDLFQPTLHRATRDPSLPAPWQVQSQLYVAFFGGCVSVAAIAWLNVRRLGGDKLVEGRKVVRLSLLVWVLATVLAGVLLLTLGIDEDRQRYARWTLRAFAVGLHFGLARIQQPLERRYEALYDDPEYASLWRPGFVAVIAGNLVQGLPIAALTLLWKVLGYA